MTTREPAALPLRELPEDAAEFRLGENAGPDVDMVAGEDDA